MKIEKQGILWGIRQDLSKALLYLLAAQESYVQLDELSRQNQEKEGKEKKEYLARRGGKDVKEDVEREGKSRQERSGSSFRRPLDGLHTHTLFYLAQVCTCCGLLEKG